MTSVMLAEAWDGSKDVTGWHISEKLDGVRAWWDGARFLSRLGNPFPAPDWFTARMPRDVVLDGELWCGRGRFQQAVSIIKNARRGDDWQYVQFMCFDAPEAEGGWEARMARARAALAGRGAVARPVGAIACESAAHARAELAAVEARGGEGLMLRAPRSAYEPRRSKALLKVKSFRDEEARVVGAEPGKGKHAGAMGALLCRTPDGRRFKLGTGFTDAQRRRPPAAGAVVTYKYFELTAENVPRFPAFVAERDDLDWAAYCASYGAPAPKAAAALKRANSLLYTEERAEERGADAPAAGVEAPPAAAGDLEEGRGKKPRREVPTAA